MAISKVAAMDSFPERNSAGVSARRRAERRLCLVLAITVIDALDRVLAQHERLS